MLILPTVRVTIETNLLNFCFYKWTGMRGGSLAVCFRATVKARYCKNCLQFTQEQIVCHLLSV